MTSLSSVAKLINKWFQKDYTNPLPVLSGFGAFLVGFVLKEMRSTIELFVRKKDPHFNLGEIFLTALIGLIGIETFIYFLKSFLPKGLVGIALILGPTFITGKVALFLITSFFFPLGTPFLLYRYATFGLSMKKEDRSPVKIINEKSSYRRYLVNFIYYSFGIKGEDHHTSIVIGVPYVILAAEVLRIEIALFVLLGALSFYVAFMNFGFIFEIMICANILVPILSTLLCGLYCRLKSSQI